jgi:DNA polymerase-1
MAQKRRLVLIDASSIFYRAFFAIPSNLQTKDGLHTNAIYGVALAFRKLFAGRKPDLAAVVYDARGPTFRDRKYADYKAQRAPMPRELSEQLPWIDELVAAYRFPTVSKEGFEADDVIGTLTRRALAAGLEVLIVSPDKDFAQLVGDDVRTLDTFKDVTYDAELVRKKFGVPPRLFVDLLALVGDPIDNIPGVDGIGQKGAANLLDKYGSLDEILAHVDELPAKQRAALSAQRDKALLSRELARIDCEVPLDLELSSLEIEAPDPEVVNALYRRLEFFSLLGESRRGDAELAARPVAIPGSPAEARAAVEALRARGRPIAVAPIVETAAPTPAWVTGAWLGVALCAEEGGAVYLRSVDDARALLEDAAAPKLAHDWKQLWVLCARRGIALAGVVGDTMLASFLVDPARLAPHRLDQIAREYLQKLLRPVKELTGSGQSERPLASVPVEETARWAAHLAEAIVAAWPLLLLRVEELGLRAHLDRHEMPLAPILGRMELDGVRVDPEELTRVGVELRARLAEEERRVFALAGHELNLASPKQLATVLFEELKLPVIKRTKTGYSTDQEVLERLAHKHEIVARILQHRKINKLLNTYVDVLTVAATPPVSPDGRVHATWQQAAASSGRLIATDPDLQRTPIRSDEGRRIRRAFVAPAGHHVLSADWSQIELRVLAHVSGDPVLIEAFRQRVDVHRRTASELFRCAPDAVTPQQRDVGKTVNFATIYGQGATALGQILDIPRKEAQSYIDRYFATYSGVRAWLDRTIEEAHARGYVTTLLGRRRVIPELASRDDAIRQQGERIAANTPIQGSAADLCKSAMLDIARRLAAGGHRARLLMQIHDELVFEVPDDEREAVTALVRDAMEHAAPLAVPLVVDVGHGPTWADAK